MKEKVLAISSHFDDVEMGCGGSLLIHRDRGDDITIAVLNPDDPLGGDISVRETEQVLASICLGACLSLYESRRDDKEVVGELDKIHPTIIYLPHKEDYHPDHRRAHIIGMSVARKFEATTLSYVDVTSYGYWPTAIRAIDMERKVELISLFKSQIERRPEYIEILKAQNKFFGTLLPCRGQYAEGFVVQRMVL